MLILSGVISAIVLLDNLCCFIEEFGLLILIFVDLSLHELATANEAPPDALDFSSGPLDPIILPLELKHLPRFLDNHSSIVFLVSILLGLIKHSVVLLNQVRMPLLPFLEKQSHFIYKLF